jgi:transcription elongation factor/antiterminator RfaH
MIFALHVYRITNMTDTQKFPSGYPAGSNSQVILKSVPLVSVTEETGRIEETQIRQWYAIYAKPHREEIAQFHLQKEGLPTFFPKLRLPTSRSHRERIVPLFPNYLFSLLRIPEDYNLARWSPGVKHVVNCNGIPTPLPDTVIDFLRQKATPGDILTAQSNLTVGSGVRIVRGPFEGLYGIIENPPDARGRVKVLMQLLSRDVRVDLSIDSVDGGWTVEASR